MSKLLKEALKICDDAFNKRLIAMKIDDALNPPIKVLLDKKKDC